MTYILNFAKMKKSGKLNKFIPFEYSIGRTILSTRVQNSFGICLPDSIAMNGIFCGVVLRKRDGIFLFTRSGVVSSAKQVINGHAEEVCNN